MIYNAQVSYSFIMWDAYGRVKSHDWMYRMHKLNYLNYPYFQFIFFSHPRVPDRFLPMPSFTLIKICFILPVLCGKLPMLYLYGRFYFEATNMSVSSPIQLLAHLLQQNICVKYSTEWGWMTRYWQVSVLKLCGATWFWIFYSYLPFSLYRKLLHCQELIRLDGQDRNVVAGANQKQNTLCVTCSFSFLSLSWTWVFFCSLFGLLFVRPP